jgi:competence protein ComGC
MRRVVVTHKDVLAPFIALFTLNSVFLLTWTLVDPLRWERFAVGEEEWNTYGACVGGTLSKVMLGLIGAANFGALFLACQQAYHARDISGEFSESKYIGVAIYGWLQILVVGLPILFLIQRDNPTARYFLMVCMVFIVAMSMLLIIFVPVFVNYKKQQQGTRNGQSTRVSVTGIETAEDIKKKQSVSRLSDLRQSFESGPRSSVNSSGASGGGGKLLLPEHLQSINESILEEFEEKEERPPQAEDDNAAMSIAESAARAKKREIEKAVSVGRSIDQAMKSMEDYDEDEESSEQGSKGSLHIEAAPSRNNVDSEIP